MMYTNDFSLFALFTAGLAAVASAYTTPKGDTPSGNPIAKPGLTDIVPVGEPFTITWEPTTPTDGTVTLVLLRGPSTNVVPLYPIAEGIKNTGSFSWTPKADLEPDVTHYGIQLIVDADGSYQYTTQFGVSNPSFSGSSSSSSSAAVSPSSSATPSGSSSSESSSSSHAPSSAVSAVSAASQTGSSSMAMTDGHAMPTGSHMAGNSSVVAPTKSMSVPSSLKTSASGTRTSSSASSSATSTTVTTNAAAGLKVGSAIFVVAMGFAAAVL